MGLWVLKWRCKILEPQLLFYQTHHLCHNSTSTIMGLALSLSGSVCHPIHGVHTCVSRKDRERNGGGKMTEKSVHGLPAVLFFFSPTAGQRQPGHEGPSCSSTICHAPGAARTYPHKPCEQQPSVPPTHPAPSTQSHERSSLSEGICVLEKQVKQDVLFVYLVLEDVFMQGNTEDNLHPICSSNTCCICRYCNDGYPQTATKLGKLMTRVIFAIKRQSQVREVLI